MSEPNRKKPRNRGRIYQIVGISMHPDMIEAIKVEAARQGKNKSEYIRSLVREDLKIEEGEAA